MMNTTPYLVPECDCLFEEEIKKSRFLTYLHRVSSHDEAKAFVSTIKSQHPEARHHCWGYVCGRPTDSMSWGFSDDGEPSGTAGKPILAQLSGSGVGEVAAVVVRYYGGIRLGTGGLVKAYGGGVQQALKLLTTVEKRITTIVVLKMDYSLVPLVQSIVKDFSASESEVSYQQDVTMDVEIDIAQVNSFTQTIINRSGAKVIVVTPDEN
jgi:uncharacterized YigZ family protein